MTPKEKAKELFNKYMFLGNSVNSIGFSIQCALIAVDEIRDNVPLISPIQQYWEQVKLELMDL